MKLTSSYSRVITANQGVDLKGAILDFKNKMDKVDDGIGLSTGSQSMSLPRLQGIEVIDEVYMSLYRLKGVLEGMSYDPFMEILKEETGPLLLLLEDKQLVWEKWKPKAKDWLRKVMGYVYRNLEVDWRPTEVIPEDFYTV